MSLPTPSKKPTATFFDHATAWIIDKPWLTLVLLAVITAISLIGHYLSLIHI